MFFDLKYLVWRFKAFLRWLRYIRAEDKKLGGYRMFLDDERHPPRDGNPWLVVRSSLEAKTFVSEFGVPTFISFDHDLGGEDTAMEFVNWMIDAILEGEAYLPEGFAFEVHSQNPIGAENIRNKLMGFITFLSKEEYRPTVNKV